ncbi:hypothetical protein [Cypionkella sp.]|nr:hypothetical protein [Cypionkella sp.]MDZ4393907.1 hypothetical protein [Cypionkella sp.]
MIMDLICQQFPDISREQFLATLREIDPAKVRLHRLRKEVGEGTHRVA